MLLRRSHNKIRVRSGSTTLISTARPKTPTSSSKRKKDGTRRQNGTPTSGRTFNANLKNLETRNLLPSCIRFTSKSLSSPQASTSRTAPTRKTTSTAVPTATPSPSASNCKKTRRRERIPTRSRSSPATSTKWTILILRICSPSAISANPPQISPMRRPDPINMRASSSSRTR